MRQSGIYKIRNLLDNKVYIGSGTYIKHRWLDHLRLLFLGIHHSIHLQRAWNRDGKSNFAFEIVEEIVPIKNILRDREQYWINFYKAANDKYGYNINPNADSKLGTKMSDETKEKISRGMLGKKHRFAKRNRGPLTQEVKDKISKTLTGIVRGPMTEEIKNKISLAMKKRK